MKHLELLIDDYVENTVAEEDLKSHARSLDIRINEKDNSGYGLLHKILGKYEDHIIVKILKIIISANKYIDLDIQGPSLVTPLHLATYQIKKIETMDYLISQGANINAQNYKGKSPILLLKKLFNNNIQAQKHLELFFNHWEKLDFTLSDKSGNNIYSLITKIEDKELKTYAINLYDKCYKFKLNYSPIRQAWITAVIKSTFVREIKEKKKLFPLSYNLDPFDKMPIAASGLRRRVSTIRRTSKEDTRSIDHEVIMLNNSCFFTPNSTTMASNLADHGIHCSKIKPTCVIS